MHFFTPDGKSLIFYEDKQLVLRDVVTGEINHIIDLKRYELELLHLKFSPDGKNLLLMFPYEAPRLVEVATGTELQVFEQPKHSWAVWGDFCPDGRHIILGGPYDYAYRWDMVSGKVVQQYHHEQWGFLQFAVSQDNRYLVGGGGYTEAGVWDIESGEKLHKIPSKNFSPQHMTVIMLPDDQHVLLCEGTTGLIVNLPSGQHRELDTAEQRFIADAAAAHEVNLLITNAYQLTVAAQIWDARTYERLGILVPPESSPARDPYYVDITADGRYVITVQASTSRLYLWDMTSRTVIRQHDWNDHFIYGG